MKRILGWSLTTAVVLMAAAVPFGIGMGVYTNNSNWFWLCLFILVFLS